MGGVGQGQSPGAGAASVRITIFFNHLGELLYRHLERRLAGKIREFLGRSYGIEMERVVMEQPPELKFGEFALPLAFELARKLRKAPKKIAEEIVAGAGSGCRDLRGLRWRGRGTSMRGSTAVGCAGAGDDRESRRCGVAAGKILVEHTSINPNKAAHVGHLRNAILGDTFVRLLRAAGQQVDVQNYIDNTGVQVADVVVGLMHLEALNLAGVEETDAELARGAASASTTTAGICMRGFRSGTRRSCGERGTEETPADTLHAIEAGGNETAQIAELVSTAIIRRHLETMLRLGIEYDFLPRESEILHLHFWDLAFEQLKEKGVLYFETEGKNKGCWVMRRAGTALRQSRCNVTAFEPQRARRSLSEGQREL